MVRSPLERAYSYPDSTVGLEFTEMYGTYSVTGIGTATDTEVVIPPIYNGKPVTAIGSCAFRDCRKLLSVFVPEGVTSIGYGAFRDCRNLKGIFLPDSVDSICFGAFENCYSLKKVTIPNKIISIEGCLFKNCKALTSVIMSDKVTFIGEKAFDGCDCLKDIILGGVITIDINAFSRCKEMKSITLPKTLKTIEAYTFFSCFNLTHIIFKGTMMQWNAIKKCYRWDLCTADYTVHCSDGNIPKQPSNNK